MDALLFIAGAVSAAAALAYRKRTHVVYTCGPDCDCTSSTPKSGRRAPAIPDRSGAKRVTIAPGASVWLCTCGESKSFPLCDGSHKAFNAKNGTAFKPSQLKNEGTEATTSYLCSCGHGKRDGLCDGTHRRVALKA